MEQHALAILEQNDLWNWPDMKWIQASESKFQAATPKLLYFLIVESQKLGGKVLDHFWKQLGTCDEKLEENSSLSFVIVERLKEEGFVSARKSREVLFQGLDPRNVNFKPVLDMAVEFFTHLGIALMDPGGRKSGSSTEFSVSEVIDEETDKILQQVNEEVGFGKRNQEYLKALVCIHSSRSHAILFIAVLSSHLNPDTLKCIAMFAGADARDDVVSHLNSIGNVMNMQLDAHDSYDKLKWGIEAKEEGEEFKYFFQMISTKPNIHSPGFITLRDGDEIQFGKGSDGKKLNNGPIPRLCNLQLAVARVLKMSGAADVILEWIEHADDDGCYCPFIASEEFCEMLDAKLSLSGRAMVAWLSPPYQKVLITNLFGLNLRDPMSPQSLVAIWNIT
ncbi:hypothetical protein OG21DRAFT_1405907 [Imleria badia]|nr:hypothetical protein OG21DRAFT_1405907 [Imleria badia]